MLKSDTGRALLLLVAGAATAALLVIAPAGIVSWIVAMGATALLIFGGIGLMERPAPVIPLPAVPATLASSPPVAITHYVDPEAER